MQQFQVPQFITIEDRIIGPLTLKQFLYLLGAAGSGIVGWFIFPFVLFAIISLPLAALFIGMAFLKINDRALPTILFSAVNYYLKPRLYLWMHEDEKAAKQKEEKGEAPEPTLKLSEGKLSELAWSLDIKERLAAKDEVRGTGS